MVLFEELNEEGKAQVENQVKTRKPGRSELVFLFMIRFLLLLLGIRLYC